MMDAVWDLIVAAVVLAWTWLARQLRRFNGHVWWIMSAVCGVAVGTAGSLTAMTWHQIVVTSGALGVGYILGLWMARRHRVRR